MSFKEILAMVKWACKDLLYSGDKGHEDVIIQCATQIYIAQMNGNKKENEHEQDNGC